MFTGYRDKKINENALTKCDKCDCFILSDSSNSHNDKCIRFGDDKGPCGDRAAFCDNARADRKRELFGGEKDGYNSGPDELQSREGSGIILKTEKCQNTLKIVVKGCDECETDSSTKEKSASETGSTTGKGTENDYRMKNICFRLCRKKKTDKNTGKVNNGDQNVGSVPKPTIRSQDSGIQTSAVAVNDTKNQLNDTKNQSSDFNAESYLKQYCPCKSGSNGSGGGNTNTIIFPREKLGCDGVCNLECFLKSEARYNARNVEEILNELHKQRREIQELKDILDIIMRGLRDQMFMTFGKTKNGYRDIIEDLRKNNLERKSNSISITRSVEEGKPESPEDTKQVINSSSVPKLDGTKKKRWFFTWCK